MGEAKSDLFQYNLFTLSNHLRFSPLTTYLIECLEIPLFMLDTVRNLVDKIDRTEVQFLDARVYTSEILSLTYRKGNPSNVSSEIRSGVAIRALKDGAWGFASVASLDPVEIRNAIHAAIKMAKGLSSRIRTKAEVTTDVAYEAYNEYKPKEDPREYDFEFKMGLAKKIDDILRNYDPSIKSSSGSYSEMIQREEIVNTNGTNVVTDYAALRLFAAASSRRGDVIQNVSDSVATSGGLEHILKWDIDENATKLAQRAVNLLDAVNAPAGKQNVLLDPSIVGVYIHEAFGHASEGDAILSNRSVLRDQIGEVMAIPEISVYDDPTIPGLRGTFLYDSEGTPTKMRKIIENGKLVGYLNDLQTSTQLDQPILGGGRAQDFRHTVMPRMGNTYIGNGDKTLEELIEMIGNGVYLQSSYGGYVNPITGEFFFSSQGGYLIEDGQLTKPIRNSGLSGMTLDVLKNTIGVGNDLDLEAFPGTCGKPSLTGAQMVPVSAGGPHIAAKDIVVGGR